MTLILMRPDIINVQAAIRICVLCGLYDRGKIYKKQGGWVVQLFHHVLTGLNQFKAQKKELLLRQVDIHLDT